MRSKVHSKKIFAEIKTKVLYLETIPTMGSSDVPQSITEVFGTTVRKLPNPPFLVLYEYCEEDQLITVDALIHERQAY
ncbi:MAG: type II toxin-antitoxin system RelE/ParE family toxin [Raoultibacter sp.]